MRLRDQSTPDTDQRSTCTIVTSLFIMLGNLFTGKRGHTTDLHLINIDNCSNNLVLIVSVESHLVHDGSFRKKILHVLR